MRKHMRNKNFLKTSDIKKKLFACCKILFAHHGNEYAYLMNDYFYEDNIFWFRHLGNNNDDKYYIYISIGAKDKDGIDAATIGFFALLNKYVLDNLNIAEQFHLTPYIFWGETTPFAENMENAFENYFVQPCMKEEDIEKCKYVLLSYMLPKKMGQSNQNYIEADEKISKYAFLYKKYVKYTSKVQNYINTSIDTLHIDKKTLGVHIRGVEWGNVKNHPLPLKIEKYCEIIDRLLKNNLYTKIFLATDSEDNVELFQEKYCEKVVFYKDAARTKKGSKQLIIFNSEQKNKPNGKIQMGMEVLRDMEALSHCGGLVAGLSNVSFTARYVKESRGEAYQDVEIIRNEILREQGISMKQCAVVQESMNIKR